MIQLLLLGGVSLQNVSNALLYNYNPFVEEKEHDTQPAQHLFFWAVLFNRMKYAKIFWEQSPDQIGE